MVNPRIVQTKLTQSGIHLPPPQELLKVHQEQVARDGEVARIKAEKEANAARRAVRRKREILTVLWGALFLLGGGSVWFASSREESHMPDAWKETSGLVDGSGDMQTSTRPSGGTQGNLLRLKWPPHPQAESYLLQFMDRNGNGPAPIPVQGTIFLYDMESDVLRLPGQFQWEVTALLPDGSQVVTPRVEYPEPGAQEPARPREP